MARAFILALAALAIFASADAKSSSYRYLPTYLKCDGPHGYNTVLYRVTFNMQWTKRLFPTTVPNGAHTSPLTAAAHSRRYSPFAVYSYADRAVEMVAESGNNTMLVKQLYKNPMVGSVGFLKKPTSNNGPAKVYIKTNLRKGYTSASAIVMLAPSPDWVAAFNNLNLCRNGYWVRKIRGPLYGIDAGTEYKIGVDQRPRQNMYPLQRPRYPRYEIYPVGHFLVEKVWHSRK